MKKRVLAMLLTAMMVFSLTACGNKNESETSKDTSESEVTSTDAPTSDEASTDSNTVSAADLKIGFMVPDSITDAGWSKQGADAINTIADQYGCKVSIVQASTADEMKAEAEAFADDGYQIIIGHGSQYGTPFQEICEDYPDVKFFTNGGSVTGTNLYPIRSDVQMAFYMDGVIAGLTTKTNIGGGIISGEYSSVILTLAAFREGAESVNADFQFKPVCLSTEDVNEAYEATNSLIGEGVDVIITDSNSANIGVFNACEKAGVYCMSSGDDYTVEYPTIALAAEITNNNATFGGVVDGYLNNSYEITEEGYLICGYNAGHWTFKLNDALIATLPSDIAAKVSAVPDDYQDKLLSGEIKCPTVDDIDNGTVIVFEN